MPICNGTLNRTVHSKQLPYSLCEIYHSFRFFLSLSLCDIERKNLFFPCRTDKLFFFFFFFADENRKERVMNWKLFSITSFLLLPSSVEIWMNQGTDRTDKERERELFWIERKGNKEEMESEWVSPYIYLSFSLTLPAPTRITNLIKDPFDYAKKSPFHQKIYTARNFLLQDSYGKKYLLHRRLMRKWYGLIKNENYFHMFERGIAVKQTLFSDLFLYSSLSLKEKIWRKRERKEAFRHLELPLESKNEGWRKISS